MTNPSTFIFWAVLVIIVVFAVGAMTGTGATFINWIMKSYIRRIVAGLVGIGVLLLILLFQRYSH